MAISNLERTHIIKLAIGLMDTVPGVSSLAKLISAYENNGRSLLALARELADTAEYLARNPVSQTAAEFATAVLAPFGLQHNTLARESITGKFDDGIPKGRIVYEWLAILDTSTNAAFRSAKETLHKKAAL
jgi:hypothetical protein